MVDYLFKGYTEDLTENILDSIIEEVKRIDSIQNMIPENRMFQFKAYFRGLKNGLDIVSKGFLMHDMIKDPIIRTIEDDIIMGIVSGKLTYRQAWDTVKKDIAGLK